MLENFPEILTEVLPFMIKRVPVCLIYAGNPLFMCHGFLCPELTPVRTVIDRLLVFSPDLLTHLEFDSLVGTVIRPFFQLPLLRLDLPRLWMTAPQVGLNPDFLSHRIRSNLFAHISTSIPFILFDRVSVTVCPVIRF